MLSEVYREPEDHGRRASYGGPFLSGSSSSGCLIDDINDSPLSIPVRHCLVDQLDQLKTNPCDDSGLFDTSQDAFIVCVRVCGIIGLRLSYLLQRFTRTKWWVIPLVWIPVALAMIYTAIVKENVPLSRIPPLCVGGILLWSTLEYLIHRFLFHMKTSSHWGNTLHYLLHGFHHKYPMDVDRLVFPPLFCAPIQLMVWNSIGTWAAAYPDKLVIYALCLIYYVIYDVTHYFLHFGTAYSYYSSYLKRYHLNHHFKNQTLGFGVTSIIWDVVFRTKPSNKPSMD